VEVQKEYPFRGLITIGIMLATIMQVLDTTIANVALPHMQGSLSATQEQVFWVLTSYIVASAIMTLPTGWLAGRYGRKRVFTTAIIGFTISSLLCGLAISIEQMVAFRLLQGCFGASIVPLAQATMLDINPPEKRGSAMALWGMGVMIGPILGPTLGGYLTENYDWRWVFLINLPLGILAYFVIQLFMPDSEREQRPFDKFGFFCLAMLIGCLQLILDRGEHLDWFDSQEIIFYGVVAASCLWMYVVHSRQARHPFLSPELFLDRNLVTSLFFIFFTGIILLATMALLPPYLQNLMGYPVLDVGILMAPRGVGTMVAMMLVGRLVNRIDPRLLILIGLAFNGSSLYFMTKFSLFVPARMLIWTGAMQGFGLGFIFIPLNTIAFATLAPRYRAEAASVFSLSRNMGSSIGISLVMAVLSRNMLINHAILAENFSAQNLGFSWQLIPQSLLMNAADVLAIVDLEVTRQAAAIAYVNDFKLMMWIVLASAPLVLLLRRPASVAAAAA
jgi:MFS transporter, DHA2 family, multidrug resistance protein